MTVLDITLHYLTPMGQRQLRAMYRIREVYGFSKGAFARISGLPTDEIPRIAGKAKEHIRQAIAAHQESKERSEKAS
jgi:hypothetical protein